MSLNLSDPFAFSPLCAWDTLCWKACFCPCCVTAFNSVFFDTVTSVEDSLANDQSVDLRNAMTPNKSSFLAGCCGGFWILPCWAAMERRKLRRVTTLVAAAGHNEQPSLALTRDALQLTARRVLRRDYVHGEAPLVMPPVDDPTVVDDWMTGLFCPCCSTAQVTRAMAIQGLRSVSSIAGQAARRSWSKLSSAIRGGPRTSTASSTTGDTSTGVPVMSSSSEPPDHDDIEPTEQV